MSESDVTEQPTSNLMVCDDCGLRHDNVDCFNPMSAEIERLTACYNAEVEAQRPYIESTDAQIDNLSKENERLRAALEEITELKVTGPVPPRASRSPLVSHRRH